MFDFGFWELALAVLVALIVVGPKRLPGLAAQTGRYIGRVKRMAREFRRQLESEASWEQLSETVEEQKQVIRRLQTDLDVTAAGADKDESTIQGSHGAGDGDVIEEAITEGRYVRDPDPESDGARSNGTKGTDGTRADEKRGL